jgi:hypothetical protein
MICVWQVFGGVQKFTVIAGNLNYETNGSSAICSSIKQGTDLLFLLAFAYKSQTVLPSQDGTTTKSAPGVAGAQSGAAAFFFHFFQVFL